MRSELPRSERQREASRLNGAKSRGPKTPEGKRISSLNALRREVLAQNVLIRGESRPHFESLVRQLFAEFQPLPGTETALVESMAVARWRLYRLWALEAAAVSHEVVNHKQKMGKEFDDPTHLVYAVRSLTDQSRFLAFIASQQARCELQYARAHKLLLASLAQRGSNFRQVPSGIPKEDLPDPIENTDSGPPAEESE